MKACELRTQVQLYIVYSSHDMGTSVCSSLHNKNNSLTIRRLSDATVADHVENIQKVKGKGTVKPLMEVFHGTATECHLLYGITQCYLLPDTTEHTPPCTPAMQAGTRFTYPGGMEG